MGIRKQRSTVEYNPLRWSLETGSREFDIHRETLRKRLSASSAVAGDDGCFSTQQICEALFGSQHRERLRKTTAEATYWETRNNRLSSEYLNRKDLDRSLEKTFLFIKETIWSNAMIPEHVRRSVLQTLADYQPPA
jgi:hypothetical protein